VRGGKPVRVGHASLVRRIFVGPSYFSAVLANGPYIRSDVAKIRRRSPPPPLAGRGKTVRDANPSGTQTRQGGTRNSRSRPSPRRGGGEFRLSAALTGPALLPPPYGGSP